MNCTVTVRYYGGAYIARAGRGEKACSASSTDREIIAVQRAAEKYFRLNSSNGQGADHMELQVLPQADPVTYFVAVGVEIGGAS